MDTYPEHYNICVQPATPKVNNGEEKKCTKLNKPRFDTNSTCTLKKVFYYTYRSLQGFPNLRGGYTSAKILSNCTKQSISALFTLCEWW